MLKQALCLPGSVHDQISVLGRKELLATINKAKVNWLNYLISVYKHHEICHFHHAHWC